MSRVLPRISLLLATVALVLVVTELGFRAFWDGYYLKGDRVYMTPSATRGWANRPSTIAMYGEPEFHFEVSHNALGFRGPEIPAEKPAGKLRVLILGDSLTYGIGVTDDETFSARLAALEPRVEVVNTGVNGYGTAQELLVLRDQGLALQPDVVVVAFFWNDVGNNFNRTFPRFELKEGKLVWPEAMVIPADVATPAPKRRAWLRYSYLYRFVSDRLKMVSFRLKLLLHLPLETTDFVGDADRESAWQLTAALIREIRDEATSIGARTVVAMIPDQVQVEPDVRVVGLEPADYSMQERLRAICSALDVSVLDLLPPLREAFAKEGKPLYYAHDRHLRARGHEIVAGALRAELDALFPPGVASK